MTSNSLRRRLPVVAAVTLALLVAPPTHAYAANDAFFKLLRILRDRGSISPEEYEELKAAAGADDDRDTAGVGGPAGNGAATVAPTLTSTTRALPAAAVAPGTVDDAPHALASAGALTTRGQALDAQVARQDVTRTAPANRWYDRIGLRGYTQFRFSQAGRSAHGPDVEVPADRSVNPNETFGIRRGRFIFSGDLSDRLYLYAQPDFNASTGAPDFSLQLRDLYADIALDRAKTFRVRLGQSKVPFGWVNMQSSQNRGPLERPDALNSAVEGERDLGAYLMWASPEVRLRLRDLVAQGLKGSGDYGVVAIGAYSGQGLNRSDQNGSPHWIARLSYPFKLPGGQFFEFGAQAYRGRFVPAVQALAVDGGVVTPVRDADGVLDERVGVSAVWYPQPFGLEAEWNVGRGPELDGDLQQIRARRLTGGYVQASYRRTDGSASWFPFVRWQYFEGGRKFARNAPRSRINEVDFGLEMARWAEVELTMIYTRTFTRTRTSLFPYADARGVNRLGVQVQWNY